MLWFESGFVPKVNYLSNDALVEELIDLNFELSGLLKETIDMNTQLRNIINDQHNLLRL